MEGIVTTTKNYEDFKKTLDIELQKNVDSFIKIGYLLKIARDTDILYKSGYKSVTEFAAAEYRLTKDVVSRYIAINDRYSENGYGEQLKEEYRAFGVAKLAEMLTLSDEVIQSLSPELTRKEIQEVKREIKEEEKITDIEVMMEPTPAERPEYDTLTEETLYQYLKENREEFKKIFAVMEAGGKYEDITEKLLDIIAPSGVVAKTVRIPGKGKIMISIKGKDEKVDFLNVRTNEKESQEWQMIVVYLGGILGDTDYSTNAEETYKELYGEPFETPEEKTEVLEEIKEKLEVAPVQPAENKNIVTNKAENKDIASEAAEETTTEPPEETKKEDPEVEKVTGEVVEESRDLEEIKEKLASAFIKRYTTRLEESENMRDEVFLILDKVHKSEWILEHNGEEYFVVEAAGYIKLRKGEEIITTFHWDDFYQLFHKVYWKDAEHYTPQAEKKFKSCTGATEEQLPGQKTIADYPEALPGNIKSNMEIWQEIKAQAKEIIEQITAETEKDNYSIVKWHTKNLAELLEEIR